MEDRLIGASQDAARRQIEQRQENVSGFLLVWGMLAAGFVIDALRRRGASQSASEQGARTESLPTAMRANVKSELRGFLKFLAVLMVVVFIFGKFVVG